MRKRKGELALFAAAFLYGFSGVFSKLINFQLPFFYQSWIRNVFSILVIGALVLFSKKWKRVSKKDSLWFFLRSFSGFISYVGLFIAFTKLDIGTTYFLSYAASIAAGYILGGVVFRERLTKRGGVAFLLAVIGSLLVYNVTIRSDTLLYIVLAIISGIASPGWTAFSKKISSTYSNIQMNFIDTLYAFLFPFLLSFFWHEQWVPITFSLIWVYTFLFALLFLITGLLIVYGFQRVTAQSGTIILLFEIIVGIVLGFLFFHETLSIVGYVGGIFILASIIIQSTTALIEDVVI
jgi:drug/metabolite transporter (DMT)-like permease